VNRSVSVIIIARDEPLIRYALKSLEYQEVKPYEIIVVVDSPDDKSAEIASEFTDKLPVRVVVNDIKPGYGGARRKGVEVARGSILAFIDADILVPPWWLSRVVGDLEQYLVVTGPEIPLKRSEVYGTVNALPKMRMPLDCKYSYMVCADAKPRSSKERARDRWELRREVRHRRRRLRLLSSIKESWNQHFTR